MPLYGDRLRRYGPDVSTWSEDRLKQRIDEHGGGRTASGVQSAAEHVCALTVRNPAFCRLIHLVAPVPAHMQLRKEDDWFICGGGGHPLQIRLKPYLRSIMTDLQRLPRTADASSTVHVLDAAMTGRAESHLSLIHI